MDEKQSPEEEGGMTDHKALIEKYAETYMAHQQYPIAETRAAMEEALADALEAATAVRAEVEAQALEQAAVDLFKDKGMPEVQRLTSGTWLHSRAAEIREGRA